MSQGNGLGLWKTRETVAHLPVNFGVVWVAFTAEVARDLSRERLEKPLLWQNSFDCGR